MSYPLLMPAPMPVPDLVRILLPLLTTPPPPPVAPPPVVIGASGANPIAGLAVQVLLAVLYIGVVEKVDEILYPPDQSQEELHDLLMGFVQLFDSEFNSPDAIPMPAVARRPKRKIRQRTRWRIHGYSRANGGRPKKGR